MQSINVLNGPPLSLVVLPFENTGEDAADNDLATGITDDLTTKLSIFPQRSSSPVQQLTRTGQGCGHQAGLAGILAFVRRTR